MPVLAFERIEGVADGKQPPEPLPGHITRLLAKAGVPLPKFGKMPFAQVDKALQGLSIERRMRVKGELAQLGLIG